MSCEKLFSFIFFIRRSFDRFLCPFVTWRWKLFMVDVCRLIKIIFFDVPVYVLRRDFFLPGDYYKGMCSCDSQTKRIFEFFLNFDWNHWSVGEQKLIQWQIDGTSKHPPSKIHWWNFWTTPSNLLNHFKLIDLYSTFYLNFVYFFLFSF